ncbi:MAG: WYL domain-containing protein [Acidobacteriaceae bacterium]
MTRTERLSLLLEIVRRAGPVTGPQLASVFGTTDKTVYRDIELLRAEGHRIEATEDGFQLLPDTAQTPAIFTVEELEAILAGLSWVGNDDESPLAEAANSATAKIEAMLPPPGDPADSIPNSDDPLDIIRATINAERKLHLEYRDAKGRPSARIVWPIQLDRYDDTGMVAAWCERRNDFRNFRVDRIESLHMLDRYPVRRKTLLARWQLQQDEGDFY